MPPKPVSPEPAAPGTFGVLVRLFFSRFFDKESLSPQGDPEANVVQTLGILAAPGGFFSLLLYVLDPQPIHRWDLVSARCMFLWVSMIVVSFIVVFEWDALFLDRRDYQVLLPLPLSLWKIFLAKMTAFILFLGLFLAAIHGAATLFWPSIYDSGGALQVISVHLLISVISGLFAAFSAASIQGLLLLLVPAKYFRPVATCVQTILMTILVMLFFLSLPLAGFIRQAVPAFPHLARFMPGYWYAGLYERLHPATGNPALLDLGKLALPALAIAILLFAITHLPGYLWQMRRLIEAQPVNPSGPGALRLAMHRVMDRHVLKNDIQSAVFHYISQTICRSMKHRLFLAVYAGFGAALVVFNFLYAFNVTGFGASFRIVSFVPDRAMLLRIPLTVSFVLVTGLRAAFSFPAELTANWCFQLTGANQADQCGEAIRKWVLVCGIIPLFILIVPAQLHYLPWTVVAWSVAYGIILSILLTEIMFLGFRKIPFTCGYFPGRRNLVFVLAAYVGSLLIYSSDITTDLESRLIRNPLQAVVFMVAAVLGWRQLSRLNTEVEDNSELDYLGDSDPLIRTLGLTPQ